MVNSFIDIRSCFLDSYRAYCINALLPALLRNGAGGKYNIIIPKNYTVNFLAPGTQYFTLKSTLPVFEKANWWQSRSILKLLQNANADILLSFDKACPEKWSGKKIVFFDRENFAHLQLKNLGSAAAIGFTTNYLKDVFSAAFPSLREKTFLATGIYKNLSKEKPTLKKVKETITDEKEFFMCTDFDLSEVALIHLLKAFSIFKKRQQSNWKLVIGCRDDKTDALIKKTIRQYKFREDVVPVTAVEIKDILPQAYCLISVSQVETFPVAVFEAYSVATPVVAHHTKTLQNMCANAVLFASSYTPEALAEEMMFLYKDESYRQQLLQHIPPILKAFNITAAVNALNKAMKNALA